MNANNVFWSEFLKMYKSLPVLWKVSSENYCNREDREAAYEKLLDKMKKIDPEANMGTVQRKINTFRTNYRRELNKIKKSEKSGAGPDDVYQPTLFYFDLLHFITDQEEHSMEESTTIDEDSGSNEVFEPPVQRKKVKGDNIPKMTSEKLNKSNDPTSVPSEGLASRYADNVFWSEFLEMYKSLPVLWKVNSENYCNRVERAAAYDKLVEKLKEIDPEANVGKVQKKINTFRTNYRRELKKMRIAEKSGVFSDDVFPPTLWYFDLLSFLEDQESARSNEVFELPVKRKKVTKDDILKMASVKFKESKDAVNVKVWDSQYADNMFWYEFLEMYKSLPVLWKVNSENYCNRVERAAACDKLVDKLKEIDPEADRKKVQRKINTFRTNYRRELKKMKKLEKYYDAGADDVFQSTLWYFDLLHFLIDQEVHSKEESTVSDDDSVSDRSDEVFEEDEIIMPSEKLDESNDDAFDLAEDWASRYAELDNKQRVLARRIWADVLFHGRMNRLTEKMVEDFHHVLKGTSNTSTSTPTTRPSSTPLNDEYSFSPQPQFTFVAYQQNKETLVSLPIKSEQCDVLRQDPSAELPFRSTTHSLRSRSIVTSKEGIQRSSSTPTNLKEYIVSFGNDNENQNVLTNSDDEIEGIIEEVEYEDMKYEVDDEEDMMRSIEHEASPHDEMNNKNLSQNPEENRTSNAKKVAVSILNHIRESKLKTSTRRRFINWKKLNDDERREVKRLQRKRDYVCDQCGRHFTDSSNLKLHLIRHSGIKNYECEECKAKFYTAHLLKRHSLMHRNSPPMFACKYCERKFFSSDLRLHHERTHFMERQFDCQYCSKSFFTKDQLKGHEIVHTRIRKYHCELCNLHFLRGHHLRRHYRSKAHKKNEQKKK